MVDSRAKGRTAETNCRDELRKLTGLQWERTPMSGALDAVHLLKGDLYVPGKDTKYCVEVKHYKDDHINTKLLTSKSPQFREWWKQTIRESKQISKDPLLIFKHNRSKWFAAFIDYNIVLRATEKYDCMILTPDDICITLLTNFCKEANFCNDPYNE